MNEEQIKAELIAKNPELAKNPAALQAAVQNAMKGQTPSDFGGGTASEAPKSKVNILGDMAKAVNANQAGLGGAAMSGIQPTVQQKVEDQKIIDETAEATGLERDKGLLKGNAVHSDEVAKNLADRGVAVTDEYKEKHPEVYKQEEVAETVKEANAVAQPSKNDTPVEKKAKNKYRNQSMSIWDAYYNGEFGDPNSDEAKSTRNYFIVDAIANFAKNTGRSIGNIGAQYSGGTIDTGHDTSKWEEIRNTLGGEELSIAKEQLGGPAERRATSEMLSNKLTALSANRAATVNDLIEEVKKAADEAESETVKKSYLALAAMLSGANMNGVSLGATAATGLIEDITNALKGE